MQGDTDFLFQRTLPQHTEWRCAFQRTSRELYKKNNNNKKWFVHKDWSDVFKSRTMNRSLEFTVSVPHFYEINNQKQLYMIFQDEEGERGLSMARSHEVFLRWDFKVAGMQRTRLCEKKKKVGERGEDCGKVTHLYMLLSFLFHSKNKILDMTLSLSLPLSILSLSPSHTHSILERHSMMHYPDVDARCPFAIKLKVCVWLLR